MVLINTCTQGVDGVAYRVVWLFKNRTSSEALYISANLLYRLTPNSPSKYWMDSANIFFIHYYVA